MIECGIMSITQEDGTFYLKKILKNLFPFVSLQKTILQRSLCLLGRCFHLLIASEFNCCVNFL